MIGANVDLSLGIEKGHISYFEGKSKVVQDDFRFLFG